MKRTKNMSTEALPSSKQNQLEPTSNKLCIAFFPENPKIGFKQRYLKETDCTLNSSGKKQLSKFNQNLKQLNLLME